MYVNLCLGLKPEILNCREISRPLLSILVDMLEALSTRIRLLEA